MSRSVPSLPASVGVLVPLQWVAMHTHTQMRKLIADLKSADVFIVRVGGQDLVSRQDIERIFGVKQIPKEASTPEDSQFASITLKLRQQGEELEHLRLLIHQIQARSPGSPRKPKERQEDANSREGDHASC